MMSYEINQIVDYLSKNSIITQSSKSSKSIYFYFKDLSIRYSDHKTAFPRRGQIQVIRKSHRVLVLCPGDKEYSEYNERRGYYFIRRLIKNFERSFKGYSGKVPQKYMKWKARIKETRAYKIHLNGLSGISKNDLKNDRLRSLESLIYVEKRLYLM